ncbi:hypothetical protein VTK73DRAFT_3907 [Phialemonium thermophilum]|uniref:Uncharacterized protein n=1 Tax=Phialemonium thermophilum TaxID=223376 RepID=A0ABR3WWZ5_9PEZI
MASTFFSGTKYRIFIKVIFLIIHNSGFRRKPQGFSQSGLHASTKSSFVSARRTISWPSFVVKCGLATSCRSRPLACRPSPSPLKNSWSFHTTIPAPVILHRQLQLASIA